MTEAEEATKQSTVRIFRHFAEKLGQLPEYDPDVVELIHAFEGLADLVESAAEMPKENRLAAIARVMERAVARIPRHDRA